jgi:hypothetical protein
MWLPEVLVHLCDRLSVGLAARRFVVYANLLAVIQIILYVLIIVGRLCYVGQHGHRRPN